MKKFVYKNFVERKMHLSKILTISFIHQVQDSCRIRIHHSARNKESSRSSRKKKIQRVRTWKKKFSKAAWKPRGREQISVVWRI